MAFDITLTETADGAQKQIQVDINPPSGVGTVMSYRVSMKEPEETAYTYETLSYAETVTIDVSDNGVYSIMVQATTLVSVSSGGAPRFTVTPTSEAPTATIRVMGLLGDEVEELDGILGNVQDSLDRKLFDEITINGTPTSTTNFLGNDDQGLSETDDAYNGKPIRSIDKGSNHIVTDYGGTIREFTVSPAATSTFTTNEEIAFVHDDKRHTPVFTYDSTPTPANNQFVGDSAQGLSSEDDYYNGKLIYAIDQGTYHVITDYIGATRYFTVLPTVAGVFDDSETFCFVPQCVVDEAVFNLHIANVTTLHLPSQSGASGKYLTSNGTVASWGTPSATPTAHKTTHQNGGSDEVLLDASQVQSSSKDYAAYFAAATGFLTPSSVTGAELTRLSGVSSAIQTQLNGKAATSHSHTTSNITDFPSYGAGEADKYLRVNAAGNGIIWST